MIFIEPRLLCDNAIIKIDQKKNHVVYCFEQLMEILIDDYLTDGDLNWADAHDIAKEYIIMLMMEKNQS